jgi:hypothetical protein
MRNYSQISPQWWTGQTGRDITRLALREDESAYTAALELRVLGDWLMTGSSHNQYGLYYAPLVIIQAETGIRPSRLQTAMATLAALEFASYDELTSFVWVREMVVWQLSREPLEREGKNGRADHRIEAARRWYRTCQENPFLGSFFDRYVDHLWLVDRREMKGLGRGSGGALKPPVPSPSLAPVMVLDQPKSHGTGLEIVPGQARVAALEVVAMWNRLAVEPFALIAAEPASLGRVVTAVRHRPDLDWWERFFADHVFTSRYLAGDNPRAWVADFWWLLDKVDEVMAGRYRDRSPAIDRTSKTQRRVSANKSAAAIVIAEIEARR